MKHNSQFESTPKPALLVFTSSTILANIKKHLREHFQQKTVVFLRRWKMTFYRLYLIVSLAILSKVNGSKWDDTKKKHLCDPLVSQCQTEEDFITFSEGVSILKFLQMSSIVEIHFVCREIVIVKQIIVRITT